MGRNECGLVLPCHFSGVCQQQVEGRPSKLLVVGDYQGDCGMRPHYSFLDFKPAEYFVVAELSKQFERVVRVSRQRSVAVLTGFRLCSGLFDVHGVFISLEVENLCESDFGPD